MYNLDAVPSTNRPALWDTSAIPTELGESQYIELLERGQDQ